MNESPGPSGLNVSLPAVRSTEIELRRYHADDAPAIVTLYNSQETESGPRSPEEFRQDVADRESAAGGELWVAVDQGIVAGYAAWRPVWWTGRHDVYALKRRAIAWGCEHGMDWFYTSSLLENAPMLAINRRLGYLPGVRKQEVARNLEESGCL